MSREYKVGVLGATGAVGREVINCLEARGFPYSEIRALASERSAGQKLDWAGGELTVAAVGLGDGRRLLNPSCGPTTPWAAPGMWISTPPGPSGRLRPTSATFPMWWPIPAPGNRKRFFVRQAYFTGADRPYEKLRKALRAEIDEAAWADLYRTQSRPFPRPATGKIAVKVINHYGDGVLKVFEV